MIEDAKVHLVDNLDEAVSFSQWLSSQPMVALDTETTGLTYYDRVRIMQVGNADTAYVLPVEEPNSWSALVQQTIGQYTGTIVGHNLPFDTNKIETTLGIRFDAGRLHDTMLQARVLEPLRSAALKNLSARYVDARAAAAQGDLSERMDGGKHTWATVPITFGPYWFYGGLDAILTYRLHHEIYPRVQEVSPLAYELERSVSAVCARMELHGALINRPYAEGARTQLEEYCERAYDWCVDNYGVKPGSNAAVIKKLEEADYEFDKLTASGAKALDKEVLGEINHPLAQVVLQRRQASKLVSTYLRHFLDDADSEGRIHPRVNTCAARTSRMSMDSPNLQNLPRRSDTNMLSLIVRNCIIARDGYTLVMCDFDQIEWRLFASLAKDPDLQAAFQADDFFTEMVRQVFNDSSAQRSDPRRQTTKNAMYARIYGAGTAKFAMTAGITEEDAKRFTAMLDLRYPAIRRLTQEIERLAEQRYATDGEAYVTSPLTKRRFMVDDDNSLYKLVNYEIQGTASEVLKMKIIELAMAGLEDYLVCPVHDEIILEVPTEDLHDVAHTVSNIMNDSDLFAVPLTASLSVGQSWGTKTAYEFPGA